MKAEFLESHFEHKSEDVSDKLLDLKVHEALTETVQSLTELRSSAIQSSFDAELIELWLKQVGQCYGHQKKP